MPIRVAVSLSPGASLSDAGGEYRTVAGKMVPAGSSRQRAPASQSVIRRCCSVVNCLGSSRGAISASDTTSPAMPRTSAITTTAKPARLRRCRLGLPARDGWLRYGGWAGYG